MNQKRIISSSTIGTEIVYELGLEAQLVGNILENELIKTLKPDVIIVEKEQNTTAINFDAVKEAWQTLLDQPVAIIVLEPGNLHTVFTHIKTVAKVLGVPERGADLIERLQERIELIRHKLKFITQKPTVAFINALEPLTIAGNWIAEMVAIAGGEAILTESGKASTIINWADFILFDPEIIVVAPTGFNIEQSLKEMDTLLQQPHFQDLQAVKNNKFFIADGNQYFNRSGLCMVNSVEILAEIINPKQFIFGYEGEGWMRFGI